MTRKLQEAGSSCLHPVEIRRRHFSVFSKRISRSSAKFFELGLQSPLILTGAQTFGTRFKALSGCLT